MGIRERKKASTRQTLIDAAARLFAERGVEATTMDDIARAAGMSRTSVFNYFGYKEMILCEIGARYVQEVSGPLLQNLDRPAAEIWLDVAEGLSKVANREPALISAVAREVTHPDPERRRVARETMGYPAAVNLMLDSFAAQGLLRHPEQRDSYAAQLVDLLAATLMRVAGNVPPERLKEEIASALEVFSGGVIALPSGDPLPSA